MDIIAAWGLLNAFNSVDWLFWGWVVVTILMFADLFIPDPIPFIDEALLILLFFAGLGMLIMRAFTQGVDVLYETATHPAILAFIVTIALLTIYGKFNKSLKRK